MFRLLGRDNRILMLSLLLWALGEGLWINLRTINMVELGATPSQIGLVLALSGVARTILLLPGGWLADRYGARNIMIASWLMGIASVILMSLASSWQALIPGEMLYGASIFALPALSSYILQAKPRRESAANDSGRILTTVYASFSAGLIFSPPIGGVIADRFGIRSTFLIASGFYVLSTVVMLLGRSYKPKLREASSARWQFLLKNKGFMTIVALTFVISLFMWMGWQFASVYLFDVYDYSLRNIGLLTGLFSASTAGLSILLGRFNPRNALAGAQFLFWLAMIIFLLSGALPAIAIAFILMGANNTVHSMASASVTQKVPISQQATAFAIIELSIALGLTAAPRIAGILFEVRPQLPFAVVAIALPLVIIASLFVLKEQEKRPAPITQPAYIGD